MINKEELQRRLVEYKKVFSERFNIEKYKWEAIKHFQSHWNIDADNFGEMFKEATDKTGNLLAARYFFPRAMIINFATANDNLTRDMFRNLFDESKDLVQRISDFIDSSESIRTKYNDGTWINSFQNTNVISIYLWLKYPDKYYIYKHNVFQSVAKELSATNKLKKGDIESVRIGFDMYDEISNVLNEDSEIKAILRNSLTDSCYQDLQLKTLTIDFCFFLHLQKNEKSEIELNDVKDGWYPKDYSPKFSVEDWINLLNDSSVFYPNCLQIMKRMKDYGGQATCKQLSEKYGDSVNFYNSGSSSLAKRIAKKTNCPLLKDNNENSKWWPILFTGKYADLDDVGSYVWRLRDELSKALDKIDLSDIPLYTVTSSSPKIWKISEGTDSTGVSANYRQAFLDRNVVVVHSTTLSKGRSLISQGQDFMKAIKKDDYFYLCFGNSIQLLGQFTSDVPVENPEMKNGWYERSYRIIAKAETNSPYTGAQKWWTPNNNSTCIKIDESDLLLFEDLILKPYFNMSVEDLLGRNVCHKKYWWLNVNPKIWSFDDLKIEEEKAYTLYNDNGNKRRVYQNFLDANVGDVLVVYEASPVRKIVGLCTITQANDGTNIYFSKTEQFSSKIEFSDIKDCPELSKMEFYSNPNGSLFKLSKEEFEFIMDIVRDQNPVNTNEISEKYTRDNFLSEVFMKADRYDELVLRIRHKKNIILQGAPGVGKTFTAKRLAYSMMGEKDESRIEFVQFHQNYSYEDFIMGYRPEGAEFKLKEGIFYNFCQKASNNPKKDFFFIIDEINRGNLSKIFGELLMLIESDYRGEKATLAYSGKNFSVPENLYIIGMMNTADRSLALIDYALRRRFSFIEIDPGFESVGFNNYMKTCNNSKFNSLIEWIIKLNDCITKDPSLGRGFRIGHSYFCARNCVDHLSEIVKFDIIPMLEEYWFDDPDKIDYWKNKLCGVFNDK